MAKLPSGRFPFINLSKALERSQSLFEADKGGKGLQVPVAFSAWGYSNKSSGGFQTVAALKHYGLILDEGANDDRAVKLTTDARKFFQTELEDDKIELRDSFARNPPLMAHLLSHWDEASVPDPVARTYLKTALGMNEQSARAALGIYKENLAYLKPKGPSDNVLKDEADGEIEPDPSRLQSERGDNPSVSTLGNESPILPREGEQEWISNVVGRGRKVRILVSGGDIGPREISKLILLLEAQRAVLEDDDLE